MKLYHNPRCSKSRQTLSILEEAGHSPTVIRYLETPLTEADLRALAKKLGARPREMMRTNEDLYRELSLKEADDDALFAAMADNPILLERPILENGRKAAIGRPPEQVIGDSLMGQLQDGFATLRRSRRPNDYLVAPDGFCQQAKPDALSPTFETSPKALYAALVKLLGAQTGVTELVRNDEECFVRYVAVTQLLRFKDDVAFQVLPLGDIATVAAYSASRVGHSDLGTNKKRVDEILMSLKGVS